jgi:hypothetical protein
MKVGIRKHIAFIFGQALTSVNSCLPGHKMKTQLRIAGIIAVKIAIAGTPAKIPELEVMPISERQANSSNLSLHHPLGLTVGW